MLLTSCRDPLRSDIIDKINDLNKQRSLVKIYIMRIESTGTIYVFSFIFSDILNYIIFHILLTYQSNKIFTYLRKEFIIIRLMSTPLGQTILIEIDGQLLNMSEVGPNKINISFDELSENLRHEVVNYELNKINYKTVQASLKGLHPNILKASLTKNPDELFVLTISVSYEFLPEIREQIIFSKRDIKPEQSEQATVRGMRNYLKTLKQQVVAMSNVQVLTGNIESTGNSFQTFLKLNHQKTLITWTITIFKPSGTVLKPQLYLYNSVTKNRQNTKAMPSEGIYMHHNGQQYLTQLRFVVDQAEKYDHALLVLEGNLKGKYVISLQKVTGS